VVLAGFRVFVAVLAASLFWIETAWPIGQFGVVFAAIATLVFASFGDQARALARDYSIGAALMSVLGGVLYFMILPALTWFSQLLIVLIVLYTLIGFMQAGKWHSVVFLAMSICALPLLGIAYPTSYNASKYFNLALAILTGTTVGTWFFVIMPTISPSTREARLIRRSVRDLRCHLSLSSSVRSARLLRVLSSRICALPAAASDSSFGALVSISTAARVVNELRHGFRETSPEHQIFLIANRALAEGNIVSATENLRRLDELCMENLSMPIQLKAKVRAEIMILFDILSHDPNVFRPIATEKANVGE
jgi:uncharacterized membrane protein YccC